MKTDIEIANESTLMPVGKVAEKIGISKDDLYCYGNYMAKISPKAGDSKLILVSAINPTAGGEGKTTISIGLADALAKAGKNISIALREPSLGPVFGFKGGATGGGYAQIGPMEDINLHFTGDMHAITSANNLLSALVDNHMYWGNEKQIEKVLWHRCQDVNDRALRNVQVGIKYNDRNDNFDITAASEVMAILCLAKDEIDLKERLGNIIVGTDKKGNIVTAKDLNAHESMAIVLKDAINPNLVQTLEGTPAFVHGGPFANIAHGCNSIIATRTAMHYSDYVVTEAGFGADLGAEKFLDIKCRVADIKPNAVVIVATLRALKCASGKKDNLDAVDNKALLDGMGNLIKHIENITGVFGLPCVVAINKFASDTDAEVMIVSDECKKFGAVVSVAECFTKGGEGGKDLAKAVLEAVDIKSKFKYCYELESSVEEKIDSICKKIYGAKSVTLSDDAKAVIKSLKGTCYEKMPIVIAKTQYSLSDDATKVGRPEGFNITIKDIQVRGGAGFLVAIAGDILLMPGFGKNPNALNMSINNSIIKGLF